MDKINKLSEAIRLGATFRPQCITYLFDHGKSCALGSAIEALGLGEGPDSAERLKVRFPVLDEPFENPVSLNTINRDLLWHVIGSLNDLHGWTREKIADWLASKGY